MSVLFGLADKDNAGVLAVFEGDAVPNPLPQGFSRVVIVERGVSSETGGGSRTIRKPAMALDAMPSRMERSLVIEANEYCQGLYNTYFRGELPHWANRRFEEELCQFANKLKGLKCEITTGRNGRPKTPRERCLELITDADKADSWPGNLTDQEWADKWRVELRTYQRSKHLFYKDFGGSCRPKSL